VSVASARIQAEHFGEALPRRSDGTVWDVFHPQLLTAEKRFLEDLDLLAFDAAVQAVHIPSDADERDHLAMSHALRGAPARAAMLLGDFRPRWREICSDDGNITFTEILNERARVSSAPLDVDEIPYSSRFLTDLGRSSFESEIRAEAAEQLRLRHDAEGTNIVESFYSQWADPNLTLPEMLGYLVEEGFDELADPTGPWIEDLRLRFNSWTSTYASPYGMPAWYMTFAGQIFQLPHELRRLPPHAEIILHQRIRDTYREAENIVRERHDVHLIGDGWVSEAALAAQIRDRLPDLPMARHARPSWLSPQHLDIYLPSINLALEYQGEQHSRPVERFGGASAFALQQQRDARKRDLCASNGCHLIEVHPGYDIDAVIAQITADR